MIQKPSGPLVVPSLRSGHCSLGARGFLNRVDPLVSVSNYQNCLSLWQLLLSLYSNGEVRKCGIIHLNICITIPTGSMLEANESQMPASIFRTNSGGSNCVALQAPCCIFLVTQGLRGVKLQLPCDHYSPVNLYCIYTFQLQANSVDKHNNSIVKSSTKKL